MTENLPDFQFQQALLALEAEKIDLIDKVEMLMQIAMGIQAKPKNSQQIENAITLYNKALDLCPTHEDLLLARIYARRGTAQQALPDTGTASLHKAKADYETALAVFNKLGTTEETAEANMNLGLVLQSLAGLNAVPITEAIKVYQKALKIFSRTDYPTEFAILHNNLATAYLSMHSASSDGKLREALAVQSFQEALKVVTMIDQPTEFAMLQNNLGNALQYVSSSHATENNIRALEAYDEALKVRNPNDTPLEYANTISNKANCLCNVPDDLTQPELGNRLNLTTARDLYREAHQLFSQYGDLHKTKMLEEVLAELNAEIGTGKAGSRRGKGFGESRI